MLYAARTAEQVLNYFLLTPRLEIFSVACAKCDDGLQFTHTHTHTFESLSLDTCQYGK
jgi:hypothetical protein